MNIQKAIKKAQIKLIKSNITSSLLDSEILMSKVLNKEREYIILNVKKELNQKDFDYFKYLVNDRAKGKPVAYITGKKFFWKYEFDVNENVLIPRPDTELIIEEILKITKNKNRLRLLDIGIGSGCIILSILKEKKNFLGTGIDLSSKCLDISKKNANKLNVSNRIKLFKSNVDKFIYGKYDLIISNPPYIKKLDLKYLEKDVINFEPKLALDGGNDGLDVIKKVIYKSRTILKKCGTLALEIGKGQQYDVSQILKDQGFTIKVLVKDYQNNVRCILANIRN